MGLFKKVKDILFDEEEYTEQIKITPEMRNEQVAPKEVDKTEEKVVPTSSLKEDKSVQSEKEVFRSFINAIIYSLNNYEHTIVDATHLNENSRRKLINSIGSENLKETSINVICLKASLDFCLKNNEKRTGLAYVPPASVEKLWHSFVIPKLEDEEYIDKLYIYQIDNPGLGYLIIERS